MAYLGKTIDLPDCTPWMTRYSHARSVSRSHETALLPAVEEACRFLTECFEQRIASQLSSS